MKKFIIFILVVITFGNVTHTIKKENIVTYLSKKNIDININSYSGWIRILKVKSRRQFYNIHLNNQNIKNYILELKKMKKNHYNLYKKNVKYVYMYKVYYINNKKGLANEYNKFR